MKIHTVLYLTIFYNLCCQIINFSENQSSDTNKNNIECSTVWASPQTKIVLICRQVGNLLPFFFSGSIIPARNKASVWREEGVQRKKKSLSIRKIVSPPSSGSSPPPPPSGAGTTGNCCTHLALARQFVQVRNRRESFFSYEEDATIAIPTFGTEQLEEKGNFAAVVYPRERGTVLFSLSTAWGGCTSSVPLLNIFRWCKDSI